MKIVLVSEEFPEETNYWWIWTYHFTLSAKLSQKWYNVIVVCKTLAHSETYINKYWATIKRVKPFFWIDNLFLYRVKIAFVVIAEQLKWKIDVIEFPEWNWELFIYYFFNIFWRSKIILRLHTPLFVCEILNKMKPSYIHKMDIWIEKFLIKHINNITCCSLSLLWEINKHMSLGGKEIKIIHNPWNDLIFDVNKQFDDIFNIASKGCINILFAWSHELRKWIDVFAMAMNVLLKKYDNINIIFVWTYWKSWNANEKLWKDDIINFFDTKHLNRVKILWKVDYYKMPNIYKHVDICIFPSIYDNYPWVVIESLLMKKTVIASINTWIKEVIKEWIIFIEPKIDSIIKETSRLIENKNSIEELWERWFQEAKKSNNLILDNIINFYKK